MPPLGDFDDGFAGHYFALALLAAGTLAGIRAILDATAEGRITADEAVERIGARLVAHEIAWCAEQADAARD